MYKTADGAWYELDMFVHPNVYKDQNLAQEGTKSLLGLKPVGLPGNIVRFQHSMIPMCMCTTIGL